ncbi:biosynthetic arginine decarboxylase [Halorhodospira halochloris]|uniref:biosynthetic arginine decarboxylase n=1 Tax=Halorhodospira halochloris TaxID=1052 RepID=UPI001EE81ECF|nr:biosynthetic arginine decarboxylase [Halorhodospira halochloris]MCG5547229.1 biosynthetic arginine decarboxylase [Halorhodospira halochloris]
MQIDSADVPAGQLYNVPLWSEGYFDISAAGRLRVRPQRDSGPAVELRQIVKELPRQGLAAPVLVRFPAILRDRVDTLCTAFSTAMQAVGYAGDYQPVYPIKVNQQRSVIEEIVADGRVGLEAGSKPELLAVIAMAPAGGTIICNGYKDPEYVRIALRGLQLGLRVHLVLEKRSEARLVMREAKRLGITPCLGIRIRLASIGAGKWQNTGGERSKFGLTVADALAVVDELGDGGLLNCLELLHFHFGSQIANVHDIRQGMGEGARFYAELHKLGVPVTKVDVGGGLGVDYEGTRSRSFCSINYSIEEYAHNVVNALQKVCAENDLPHPTLITESGRAMTAHHAVLITQVIDTDAVPAEDDLDPPAQTAPSVVRELYRCLCEHAERPATEIYHDARYYLEEAQSLYLHGILSLVERAYCERCYESVAKLLLPRLNPSRPHQREAADELNQRLADKLFANFSVFQSIPDVWGIEQIFPIVPLGGLNQPVTRRGVVQDLTCDSDGTVSLYVDGDGIENTLALPAPEPGEPLWLGVFMIGAYQEILGDRHNLFGQTDSVNVEVDEHGYHFTVVSRGDSVSAVLRSVGFDERELSGAYRRRVAGSELDEASRRACIADLEAGLLGGTYLEGGSSP